MIRTALLLATLTPQPATTEDVRAREEILAEPRYRFCHEEDYPLVDSERAFCSFVSKDAGICPALEKACKQAPKEVQDKGGTPIETKIDPGARAPTGRRSGGDDRIGVRRSTDTNKPSADGPNKSGDKGDKGENNEPGAKENSGDKGGENPKSDKPDGKEPKSDKPNENSTQKPSGENPNSRTESNEPPPPPPPPKPDPAVASVASGIARILFFLLLGGFIAFVLWMVVKNLLADSDAPPEEAPPEDALPIGQTTAKTAVRSVVETDVERLLARARAAAQRGAFGQAIDDLYAALLRRLDGDGIIEIQPFRTNGDYLRQVRSERSEIAPDVRAVLSDVESVQFGSRSPSAELFSRIHDRVVPLVTKALGFVFFIVGLSSIVSCAHLAVDEVDENPDVTVDSVFRGDSSPSGIHAITTLVNDIGVDMRQHRRPMDELPDPGISTLVLLPDYDISDIGAWRLHEWVKRGGDLVFAGGNEIPEWAGATFDHEQTSIHAVRPAPSYVSKFGPIEIQIPPGNLLRCADEDVFLIRDSLCYAEERSIEKGRVFVFADDRWFMNIALPFGDNTAFLLSFFGAVHRNVHVLDGQTSLGANTPIDSIARSNIWPILLQLFLLLGLAFLWAGRAFGTLRDPIVDRRRAFADHVRALGLAYARSGASRHVLGIYAGWAIERLRERLPRQGRRGLSGLAEALAMRTGKTTGEVMTVLVDVVDAQREIGPASQRSVAAPNRAARKDKQQVATDLALFRTLDQWLASTSRDNRKASRSSDKKTKRSL